MDKSYVKVGVLSAAGQYPSNKSGANLADVATFNEFGTSRIPSRPFMAQTFDKNLPEVKAFIAQQQSDIFQGRQTTKGGLNRLGVLYTGMTKKTFVDGEFAPNKPGTVAAKGSSRPLIDTGRLRNSITHEVILAK